MNRNCNACTMKVEKGNYLKDRTVCKSYYNKIRRKTNKDKQTLVDRDAKCQLRWHDSLPQNNRKLIAGPSFPGTTHLMLKILPRKPDHQITS